MYTNPSFRRLLITGALTAATALACGSEHQTENIGEASQALSTGGTKATTGGTKATTGGTKATTGGTKASTGGTKATGGTTAVACSPADCNDNNVCTTDKCNSGTCSHTPVAQGTPCPDGNACNGAETCNGSGTCVPGTPVVCTPPDACHVGGTCNPSNGSCSYSNAPDGTACSDNNACTQSDQCASGACVPGTPVPVDDGDRCTTDSCDPVNGVQHVPVTTDPNCAKWYSGGLKVEVRTNYCDLQKVQQYFQVTNTGATPVNLSDISIKYWVYDTTGANVVSDIYYAGCVVTSPSNLTCEHPVTGVATSGKQPSACVADGNNQANWEVTLTPTDSYALQPGHQWNNLQTVVHLDNWATFTPGTSQWYSTCLTNPGFATDPHFTVYYKGNLVFSSGINAPACAAPHGTQQLTGYLTPSSVGATLVGPVPPTTVIQVGIGLPNRDRAGLQSFIDQVSDPANSNYRQYKTLTQLTADYGPLQSDYDALVSWATSNALSVVSQYSTRTLLDVSGTASAIEKAFYVNLNYYLRSDGTQFYAPDREPSLDLTPTVSGISRLNDVVRIVPAFTPGDGGYTASDLRDAYIPCAYGRGLDGSNQCIAIAAYADTVDIGGDITEYMQNVSGLPSQYTSSFSVERVIVPSKTFIAPSLPTGHKTSLEIASDVEMALAMAPAAKIVVYVGDDFGDILETMINDPAHNCNQLSLSWTSDLASWVPTSGKPMQDTINLAAGAGKSIFMPTGDAGAWVNPYGNVETWNDNRIFDNVTLVGGTTLAKDPTTGTYSETTWPSGGGGYEPNVAAPAYQASLNAPCRLAPDVAAVAKGVEIVATFSDPIAGANCVNGGGRKSHFIVGGTSLSTPLWAGFMALVNQRIAQATAGGSAPVTPWAGTVNPTLYGLYNIGSGALYKAGFNDITSGYIDRWSTVNVCNNTDMNYSDLGNQYQAQAGFDLATGWGSPKCALIDLLAVGPQTRHVTVTANVELETCTCPDICGTAPPGGETGNVSASGSCDLSNANLTCTIDLTNYQLCLADLGLFVRSTLTLQNDGSVTVCPQDWWADGGNCGGTNGKWSGTGPCTAVAPNANVAIDTSGMNAQDTGSCNLGLCGCPTHENIGINVFNDTAP